MNKPTIAHIRQAAHLLMPSGQPPCIASLIDEFLTLINDHEYHEYHRYRWLSLRFLTYHIGISRIMQALAGESQQRIQELAEVTTRLPTRAIRPQDPATRATQDIELEVKPHFFIFDDDVAAQELSRALLAEWRSRRFYTRLQAYNGIPELNAWLEASVRQSLAQFRILQEAEDQLPSQLPSLPRLPRVDSRHVARHARGSGRGGAPKKRFPGAISHGALRQPPLD